MDLFNLETQYQLYLQRVGVKESSLLPYQAQEMKRAFMGACGQILDLLTEGLEGYTEDQAAPLLEGLFVQVAQYWTIEMIKESSNI